MQNRKGRTVSFKAVNRLIVVGLLLIVVCTATTIPLAWGQQELNRKTKTTVVPRYPELAQHVRLTIGKQPFLNFGVVLAAVLVLLAINLIAVQREHETKAAAQRSIDMTEATSSVRFQMMQNRLHLQNYLLSGDTRDVEKMNDGEHQLSDAVRHAQELAKSTQQRSSLEKVQGLEQSWGTDFANPLVDKRRGVDSGNATVAELQIFYLQKDPNSWGARS